MRRPAPLPRARRSLALVAAATLALLGVAPHPARAQDPRPPAAPAQDSLLPPTPLGHVARELLAAVNARDTAAIAHFVGRLTPNSLPGGDRAARTRALTLIAAQSGGLTVERARMAGSALRVLTRARAVPRLLGLEFDPSPDDSTRLADLGLFPMDPAMVSGPPAPWATEALSDDSLAAVVRRHVRQAADSDRFAGVVLVAHGDRVLVHDAFGYADRERRTPNTTHTRFQTTSVGKMFTGVAVAQLVRAGKLAFDDTLARVLPDYPNPDAARRTTVRQLLTHTAGVPEPFLSARFGAAPDDASHAALLATFADAPPSDRPGARHEYSNGNFVALGAIIERASGERYEDYLRRYVWEPAGMPDVTHPAWSDAPGIATAYARWADRDPLGIVPPTAAVAPARARRGVLRAFGGGAYTAEELFRFARALRTGRLLGAALTGSVTAGRVETGNGPPGAVRYGFGFYDQRRGDGPAAVRVVGHPGSNPNTGWDADVELVWDRDWTVIVLANTDAPAGIALAGPVVELIARQGAASAGAASAARR